MSHSTATTKAPVAPGSRKAAAAAIRWVAIALVLAVGALGCRTAPMQRPEPLPVARSPDDVRRAILVGARRAGWRPVDPAAAEPAGPGAAGDAGSSLVVRFTVRPGVYADVRIDFAGPQVSFRYAGSGNFSCEPVADGCERIHRSYNVRLARLRDHIAQALAEPRTPPIGVEQALSIIRQMLEEQPPRTAYAHVDVSDERISAAREVLRRTYYYDYDYFPDYYFPYYRRYGWYHHSFYDRYPIISLQPVTYSDVVYFNNIGRIELAPSGRWQVVRIWDRYGEFRMQLLSLDEAFAKRFVDALGVMEQARQATEPAQERSQL